MDRMLESLTTSGKEDVHGHALINLTGYQGGTLWKFSFQKEMRGSP